MTRTLEDLLDDNFACRDPKAGAWISAARQYEKNYKVRLQQATRESGE